MAAAGYRRRACWVLVLALLTVGLASTVAAASQDDAGSGEDAGDTFATATAIDPPVPFPYDGELDAPQGDTDDFYKFHLEQGDSLLIDVFGPHRGNLTVELLDPDGRPLDVAVQQEHDAPFVFSPLRVGPTATLAGWPLWTSLTLAEAPTEGDYRLHLASEDGEPRGYELCFRPCEGPREGPLWVDPPLYYPEDIRVLLVPPSHGDLGDPFGPTAADYVATTIQAIHAWETAIDQFTDAYPEYAYLDAISITIGVFDGEVPEDAGYDVVVAYIESGGPVFRGAASVGGSPPPDVVSELGLEEDLRHVQSEILLSLFGTAPRAGQVVPDYPELSDLFSTTMHEFGHSFGLGHTLNWSAEHGPDLMNSPATYVWGNGDPVGDGGERTPYECPSTLDMYALAQLYAWLPDGEYPEGEFGGIYEPEIESPLPEERYCERPDPWALSDLAP